MEAIIKRLEQQGYGKEHPDYDTLLELFNTVKILKETIEPFISNDPTKHRVNINIRGRILRFLATQDEEYYMRMAAVLINKKGG